MQLPGALPEPQRSQERVLRSEIATDRAPLVAILVPAVAASLATAYLTVCLLRWQNLLNTAALTLAGGSLLALAMTIPLLRALTTARVTLRAKRLALAALPLGGIVFFLPSLRLLDNLRRAQIGDALALSDRPSWLYALSGLLALAMAAGYAWQVYAIGRARLDRQSGLLHSLTASASWLAMLAAFVRFSAEAQHFHRCSRSLALALLVAATGFAAAALLRSRDARRALLFATVMALFPLIGSSLPARAHLAAGHPELPRTQDLRLPPACSTQAPVYLLPMGLSSIDIEEIAERYRQHYQLRVEVLRPVRMPRAARDRARDQWSADIVLASLARHSPETRAGTLIAITDADLFSHVRPELQHVFQLRISHPQRIAIASTARIGGALWTDEEALRSRLYKLTSKSLGLLHCGLSESRRPRSVLYRGINGVTDLDRQDESLW